LRELKVLLFLQPLFEGINTYLLVRIKKFQNNLLTNINILRLRPFLKTVHWIIEDRIKLHPITVNYKFFIQRRVWSWLRM